MLDESRHRNLAAMITPLRLIFWGGLLCLIDITYSRTVNGEGFKWDWLDDFVGMILVALGVFRLGRFAPSRSFVKGMIFVKAVAVVATVKALIDHWIFKTPEGWGLFWTFFSLAELAAMVVFCSSMVLLCRVYELDGPARSWKTTTILVVLVYAIPLGLFYAASLIAMVTGESFHLNLGPAALWLLVVFAVPLLHFFASTSRMARAAGHR